MCPASDLDSYKLWALNRLTSVRVFDHTHLFLYFYATDVMPFYQIAKGVSQQHEKNTSPGSWLDLTRRWERAARSEAGVTVTSEKILLE